MTSILLNGLQGEHAHLPPEKVLHGITFKLAGKAFQHTPYTIWQQLNHIAFWQERFLQYLKGEDFPRAVKKLDDWPKESAPANTEILEELIHSILNSIDETHALVRQKNELHYPAGYLSCYEVLSAMGNHLSYHLGQVMTLKRIAESYT